MVWGMVILKMLNLNLSLYILFTVAAIYARNFYKNLKDTPFQFIVDRACKPKERMLFYSDLEVINILSIYLQVINYFNKTHYVPRLSSLA